MSFNGSGTFVINSTGQPVVTGTVISSSTFNSLTADLGTGLTTAITKDGQTTTTAKIPFAQGLSAAVASNFAAGTVGAPSIYLSTDTTTGLYRIGANNVGFAVSGAKVLDISNTGLVVTGTVTINGIAPVSPFTAHTRQVFLSGTSATYTTPANCRQLVVRQKAGGGGAFGSQYNGTIVSTNTVGGTTSFNSITVIGGGVSVTAACGAGGTGGAGSASVRIAGAPGSMGSYFPAGANLWQVTGGSGGGSGGGAGSYGVAGAAGAANSGGGGASAGFSTSQSETTLGTNSNFGGGAGEGEYAEIIINSPAATYTYSVGAGGTGNAAGTNGFAGGAGGSGYIIVDEYY